MNVHQALYLVRVGEPMNEAPLSQSTNDIDIKSTKKGCQAFTFFNDYFSVFFFN